AAEARKQRELEAANPKPICQCGHELAFHKPGEAGSTVCAATSLVQVPDPDDAAAGVVIRIGEAPGQPQAVVQACPCQQYVGPQAYPSFWVPEVPGPVGLPRMRPRRPFWWAGRCAVTGQAAWSYFGRPRSPSPSRTRPNSGDTCSSRRRTTV